MSTHQHMSTHRDMSGGHIADRHTAVGSPHWCSLYDAATIEMPGRIRRAVNER